MKEEAWYKLSLLFLLKIDEKDHFLAKNPDITPIYISYVILLIY